MKFISLLALLLFISLPASAYEGAGLLVSDQQGALPKALWRGQPRSEIVYLLKNLPADSTMYSAQTLKRDLLLSYYDTSLVKNDVEPSNDNNLLTLRLNKLFEMGFWKDALKLYTKNISDPNNNEPLARIGMLLTIVQRGIPTACLEEKVIGPRFQEKDFWRNLSAICEREIYGTNKKDFSNSSVLTALYFNNDFRIPANDTKTLEKLSFLERVMLVQKKRVKIRQETLASDLPPFFIKLYLSATIDESTRSNLEEQASKKAIIPTPILPYDSNIDNLSEKEVFALISHKLKFNADITAKILNLAAEKTTKNSNNIIYLQIVRKIISLKRLPLKLEYNFTEEKYNFNKQQKETLFYLTEGLDKTSEFSNNQREVYEKHLSLTPEGEYGMSEGSLTEEHWQDWLNNTTNHNFAGLTLLIVLSNLENFTSAEENNNNSGDKPEKQKVNVLKSLGNVGLNNQAQEIAREVLANLMNQ